MRLEHPPCRLANIASAPLDQHSRTCDGGKGMAHFPCLLLFKPDHLRLALLVMNVHTLHHMHCTTNSMGSFMWVTSDIRQPHKAQ